MRILDNIDTEFFKACEPESKNDKHISYTSKEVKELNTKKEILELFKNEIENMRGYFSNSSNYPLTTSASQNPYNPL